MIHIQSHCLVNTEQQCAKDGATTGDSEMENVVIDWELSWYELAEMEWWEAHPNATEAEFESSFFAL